MSNALHHLNIFEIKKLRHFNVYISLNLYTKFYGFNYNSHQIIGQCARMVENWWSDQLSGGDH